MTYLISKLIHFIFSALVLFPYRLFMEMRHYVLLKKNPADHTGYGIKFKSHGHGMSFHYHDHCSCGQSAPEKELVEVFAKVVIVSFKGL